jgi:hypothetical protein
MLVEEQEVISRLRPQRPEELAAGVTARPQMQPTQLREPSIQVVAVAVDQVHERRLLAVAAW